MSARERILRRARESLVRARGPEGAEALLRDTRRVATLLCKLEGVELLSPRELGRLTALMEAALPLVQRMVLPDTPSLVGAVERVIAVGHTPQKGARGRPRDVSIFARKALEKVPDLSVAELHALAVLHGIEKIPDVSDAEAWMERTRHAWKEALRRERSRKQKTGHKTS